MRSRAGVGAGDEVGIGIGAEEEERAPTGGPTPSRPGEAAGLGVSRWLVLALSVYSLKRGNGWRQ